MTRWLPDLPDRVLRRILALWAAANDVSSLSTRMKAAEALKRLQDDHGLSDVELNYIAESEQNEPSKLDGIEHPVDVLSLIIHLIRLVGIVVSFEIALTCAFWILHTYVFHMFTYTARLVLQSRETGCGKTVLLELMERLVDQGHKADDTTPAAIYHRLKRQRNTYLLDEVEHSDLLSEKRFKALYNMGYQGGLVEIANAEFPVHFALALALVVSKSAWLSPQALRRSIVLEMTKNSEGRNKVKANSPEIATVHHLISSWADTFKPPLEEIRMPEGVTSETRNNWESLIAVAHSLGYGATARALALAMDRRIEDPVSELISTIPARDSNLKAATIPIEGGQYWPVGTFMGSQRW